MSSSSEWALPVFIDKPNRFGASSGNTSDSFMSTASGISFLANRSANRRASVDEAITNSHQKMTPGQVRGVGSRLVSCQATKIAKTSGNRKAAALIMKARTGLPSHCWALAAIEPFPLTCLDTGNIGPLQPLLKKSAGRAGFALGDQLGAGRGTRQPSSGWLSGRRERR